MGIRSPSRVLNPTAKKKKKKVSAPGCRTHNRMNVRRPLGRGHARHTPQPCNNYRDWNEATDLIQLTNYRRPNRNAVIHRRDPSGTIFTLPLPQAAVPVHSIGKKKKPFSTELRHI